MVEPQNRWNLILFELYGPYERNHFLSIWKLWPPPWLLPSDSQEVGLDCVLTEQGADRTQFTVINRDSKGPLQASDLPTIHLKQNTSPFVVDKE